MSELEERFYNSETYKKIIKNSVEITRLLQENEQLLKDFGFDPPASNIKLKDRDYARIEFPRNYIRKVPYFYNKYHLRDILVENDDDKKGENIAGNCAYALMISDVYNYFINRFNFWGVVAALIYKDGIVNFVEVIEAMVNTGTHKYAGKCDKCAKKDSCPNKIVSSELKKKVKSRDKIKLGFPELVDLLEAKAFLTDIPTEEENVYQKLKEMQRIRNYVHNTKADVNSYNNEQFCLDNYNESLRLLQIVSESMYNGIVQQNDCFECVQEKEL